MPKKVPTSIAARLLGKSENFIRFGLQQGVFDFGYGVRMTNDRWSYHISPKKLAEYTGVTLGQIYRQIELYGEDKDDEE